MRFYEIYNVCASQTLVVSLLLIAISNDKKCNSHNAHFKFQMSFETTKYSSLAGLQKNEKVEIK